jgi:gliding motility-associated-like protein
MKKLIALIFIFLVQVGYTQREANVWHFGDGAGLDFNSCEPEVVYSQMDSTEGCTSIANSTGELQFYTEGTTLWNRNHQLMSNGTGLLGHRSATQSAMIIKHPGNFNEYYVFTIDNIGGSNCLMYSIVDIDGDGGLGVVTSKNTPLIAPVVEKIHAVRHANGNDVWVSVHGYENNNFYSFLVNSTGVSAVPVTSSVGEVITNDDVDTTTIGAMKFSPNGQKLAICNYEHGVSLFNFNTSNGIFNNPVEVTDRLHTYGVEFSKSNNFLYVTTTYLNIDNKLLQYNLGASVIQDSETILSDLSDLGGFGSLQLAPNGKLYVSVFGRDYLSVVNEPDRLGVTCGFVEDGFYLGGGTAKSGLPIFLFPIFQKEMIVEETCYGDATNFYITNNNEAIIWDFGDPASGANNTSTETEPLHVFSAPGIYTITTNISAICGSTVNISREIEVFGQSSLSSIQLAQCDDNSDGFSYFNLNEADNELSQNFNNSTFQYYRTETEALSRVHSISPSSSYENVVAYSDSVWASVEVNDGCYGVVEVELLVSGSTIFETFQTIVFENCDDDQNDGVTFFDMTSAESVIEGLFFGQDVDIKFYRNIEDALSETDVISDMSMYENVNYPYYQDIYVRVDNELNNDCLVIGKPITLTVKAQPQFQLASTGVLCLSEGSSLTVGAYNPDDIYAYEWKDSNGNVISSNIDATISNSDIYTLIATSDTGCESFPKQIEVTVYEDIEITRDMILIRDGFNNNTITIIEAQLGIEDYEYALDDAFGVYQDSPFFENVVAGIHTLYVREMNSCTPSSLEISIIGFPKFFTPNNDTHNDTWNLKGLGSEYHTRSKIFIYNRYGKLLKQMDSQGDGWNGRFNGKDLAKSDYWFKAELINLEGEMRILTGHFSLIR